MIRHGLCLVMLLALTGIVGCHSRPKLKQVPKNAVERSINTPEDAARLKAQLERKPSVD